MSRRRVLAGVLIATVALVALAVAGFLALPTIVRWVTVSQLAKATGRAVTLERLELSLSDGHLVLRGLRVVDHDGAPLVMVSRADVRFEPRALLRRHAHLTDATVEGVALRIVRTGPNQFNVSDLLTRRTDQPARAPALSVDRLALVGASIAVEDRTLTPPRTWRVEPLELHARDASTVAGAAPGQATLTGVVAGAPIVLSLTGLRLAPLAFRALLTVSDVDASLAALYLPPASPLSPTRGRLSVSSTLEQSDGTLSGALVAQFTDVELHRPGQASAYLAAPAVRVMADGVRVRTGHVELGRLAVDGGSAVLEDARLGAARRWKVDDIAFEARNLSSARAAPPGVATARAATAGARLALWVSDVRLAPLELRATAIVRNVDLSLARLWLPPELPVRPERGVVNATVRVEHDGRQATRLGLDVTLGDLELQRALRVVSAPQVRVIVDGVSHEAGAVAVAGITVESDRLTVEDRATKPARRWPVQNVRVEARALSSRRDAVQGVASLRATVAGATAAVFVTGARLQPLEWRATTILRNIDAAFVRDYLPPELPLELRRGVVNATLETSQTVDGTTLTGDATLAGLEAQGRDRLATVTVTAPSARLSIAGGRRRADALSVERVELSGAGSLVDARGPGGRLDFARLHVMTENLTWPVTAPARVEVSLRFQDRGELDGSGTARLTAPLPKVAWVADVALTFRRVDLAPLAVYVPAAAGLGGRVRADLTANLAYDGGLTAHVRGDLGGARFTLVDDERARLALRGITASGLDLRWPERVSIKRLRLREPQVLTTRDRQGAWSLAERFVPAAQTSGQPARTENAAPRRALPAIAIEEVTVEDGRATLVDEAATPAARVELPRLSATLRDVSWPAKTPLTLALEGTFGSGGTLKAEGKATPEPWSVELTLACEDADLATLQPYMGFRARVRGRVAANLAVAGQLAPAVRLKVTGDAGLRSFEVSDGQRAVITADRLRVRGIDADWPARVHVDQVRVRRAWAAIERDAQGQFLLRTLFERQPTPRPASGPSPAPTLAPATPVAFSFREGRFVEQAATIVDLARTPPARLDVAGARLTVQDFSYPQRGPTRVEVKSPMPGGGQVDVAGTVQLVPMRLEARAVLDGVALEPLQSYLPIEGRVAGAVTGDVALTLTLDPLAVLVKGDAQLRRFRLNDGERAVVTVGRVETSGIDVEWPTRLGVARVLLRRPRLLIERGPDGAIRLRQLVTPRWQHVEPPAAPRADTSSPGNASSTVAAGATAPPAIEIGTLTLERALARFVDHTTHPSYAEELEDVTVTFAPLATAPGRPTRVSASGGIGGGTFSLRGEGAPGERPSLDLSLEVRDFIVPRANPYLDLYTAWVAQSGRLDVTGIYRLRGTELETRHDVVVRGLEVAAVDERDEVARRVGLPFGLLVSLLKDARGEIRLSLPVGGDLATRQFDYTEALWGSVRSLAIRLVALPFSKIGSLFFSNDSKVTAVALAPVVFEPGTGRLGPGMEPHLAQVADFLRGKPAVKLVLEPVLIEADVRALKRARVVARLTEEGEGSALERAQREFRLRWPDRPVPDTLDAIVGELAPAETLPPDAMRTLGTERIDAVRRTLTKSGVDPERLPGTARRLPLVEAAGTPRVEFDLRS